MTEEMRESPAGRSMLTLFSGCEIKWAWKYLKGYKLIDEADHLVYGSAIHESQAVYYIEGFNYEAMHNKLRSFLSERGRGDLLPKAQASLDLWYHQIGDLDTERVTVLEVEAEDNLILPNGFDMTVRRDRVLQFNDTKEIFIGDTKTTSWSFGGTIKNYMYSDQPALYIASIRQNKPEWYPHLSGWRTECIYIPKTGNARNNWGDTKRAERSDVTSFTESKLDATMKSYAVQTSDMAYKIQNVLEDKQDISANFSQCNDHCLAYHKECEYYSICHEIDTIDSPPAKFKIDPWLESGAVLDGFKGLAE